MVNLLNKIASLFIDVRVKTDNVKAEMGAVREEVKQTAAAAETATKKADASVTGVAKGIRGMFAPLNQLRSAILSVGTAIFGWVAILGAIVGAVKVASDAFKNWLEADRKRIEENKKAAKEYADFIGDLQERGTRAMFSVDVPEVGTVERLNKELELISKNELKSRQEASQGLNKQKVYQELADRIKKEREALEKGQGQYSFPDFRTIAEKNLRGLEEELRNMMASAQAAVVEEFAAKRATAYREYSDAIAKQEKELADKRKADEEKAQADKEAAFFEDEKQRAARQAIVDEAVARREAAKAEAAQLKKDAEEYWEKWREEQAKAHAEAVKQEQERQRQRLQNIEQVRRNLQDIASGFEMGSVGASIERLADAVNAGVRNRTFIP